MPDPSLEELVAAMPTVMGRDEALAAIDGFLDRAEAGADDPDAVAGALSEAVSHLSDSYTPLDPPREARLLAWIEAHYRTEPLTSFGLFFNLLANMFSDPTTAFLREKLREEKNPKIRDLLNLCLADRARIIDKRRAMAEAEAEAKARARAEAEAQIEAEAGAAGVEPVAEAGPPA